MLSITKINSASNQARKGSGGKGYAHYLGGPAATTRQRGDFDDYARGPGAEGPAPFWAGKGPALLGLDGVAEAGHVERLARGLHPLTGAPLVKGAGPDHVMGLDMTFSAPKDVSAVFAGAGAATRGSLVECLHEAAKTAFAYAESGALTRHGHGGRTKRAAEAAAVVFYTHFSNRANEPHLHAHGFFFNAGKRAGSREWGALEHRAQFERKLATGILFRAELASRLRGLGFRVEPAGPYFTIRGIGESQRLALSTRSRQIADYLRECGASDGGSAAREIAALNTKAAKAEPPLRELLVDFARVAAELGITPDAVEALRADPEPEPEAPFAVDRAEILSALTESQSCATAQEALALICERAMGRWGAAECLAELDMFLAAEDVVQLGRTEHLTQVFTSRATKDMEAAASEAVARGAGDRAHRIDPRLVDAEFARLEAELRSKLGVAAPLGQQRAAALHVACDTGRHAFLEGWAGAGKTTLLRAVGAAYKRAGLEVVGCCQSAAASQNLAREAGIPSRTIASLLLSLREGRARLGPKSVVVLDEAGMVGSREFALVQDAALAAGAKLVCVGDPKQLQPIEAGGIFRALAERHGKAEISNIQRQRTDAEPLLAWLESRGALPPFKAEALRAAPEDARLPALELLCSEDPKLRRAFGKWRARFDFEWMRGAVRMFAAGEAKAALELLDGRGCLKLASGHSATMEAVAAAWSADRTPLARKVIVAGTRAEVAELNARARAELVAKGLVADALGIDVEIERRDGSTEARRFAPGDRLLVTLNDKSLGVANGAAGTVLAIDHRAAGPALRVELDAPNERGESVVAIPASFGRIDWGFARTTHSVQGQTVDSAHVLANPSMCDREWTYVAASRSRFATVVYANLGGLARVDFESHGPMEDGPKTREAAIDALALRMRRSRAKGTSLDYDDAPGGDALDGALDAPDIASKGVRNHDDRNSPADIDRRRDPDVNPRAAAADIARCPAGDVNPRPTMSTRTTDIAVGEGPATSAIPATGRGIGIATIKAFVARTLARSATATPTRER